LVFVLLQFKQLNIIMKSYYFSGILVLAFLVFLKQQSLSQENTGILPPSFESNILVKHEIDHIFLPAPNMQKIAEEDIQDEKNGTYMKVARLLPVDITIENSGTWQQLSNGINFWSLKLSSDGAIGCALHFDKFKIPEGGEFFAYSTDKSIILGPYTNDYNPNNVEFTVGLLYGSDIILEYYPPRKTEGLANPIVLPDFELTRFSYIYRGLEYMFPEKGDGYGSSLPCQINVNCPEGNNFRTAQRGVAQMYMIIGWSAGFCSGSLVNNTSNNGTPYFLSADHCGEGASTSNMNQWLFRFNWEAPSCTYNTNTNPSPSREQVQGCTKIASGPLDGGSDFLLVRLSTTENNLKNIDAIYNGWRILGSSTAGASIHHPAGDIKKISTYSSTLTTATYYGYDHTGASSAHWLVTWTSTTSGHGVTEPGSSGSPIFDSNGLIMGTLSGGSSSCEEPTSPDLYGKMSYHWESNGSNNNQKLEPWLDPSGTGNTSCPAYDPNSAGLNADFSASTTSVAVGGIVNFTDQSTGNITSRSWSFEGGNPPTSTATNPGVMYSNAGTYDVSLTVYSGTESNTETKTNYIYVGTDPCPPIQSYPHTQNFNSADLPNCWSTQISNSSETWQSTTGYSIGDIDVNPVSGSHFWYVPWDDGQNQNEWLITPIFDLSVITSPSINFWYSGSHYRSVNPNDNCDLELLISVNGGAWTVIWDESQHPDFNDGNAYQWLNTSLSLAVYQGNSNVKFAFRYTGYDGANFAIDNIVIDGTAVTMRTLTVNTSGNGSVNVDGNQYSGPVQFTDGTSLVLQAIPETDWNFDNWTGSLGGSSNPQTLVMNANKTVTANFSQASSDQYTLTVSTSGEGSVKVNGSTYTSPLSFDSGTSVSLEAEPEELWEFDQWEGNLTGTANPQSLTMNSNKSVNAKFTDLSFVNGIELFNEITLFPNPAHSNIFVQIPEKINYSNIKIKISNIVGQKLVSLNINKNKNEIDITSLPSGLYIMEISTDDIRLVRKFQVNR
jgi:PKD repeat protein